MIRHDTPERGGNNWGHLLMFGAVMLILVAGGLAFRPVFESWLGIGVLNDPRNISVNESVFGLDVPVEAGLIVDGVFRGGDELIRITEGSFVRPAFRLTSVQPMDVGHVSFILEGAEIPTNKAFAVPQARTVPYELRLEGVGDRGRVHFGASCIFKAVATGEVVQKNLP